MKYLSIITILLYPSFDVYCQGSINVVDRSVNPGMVLEEFNNKVEVKSEQYLYFKDIWLLSNIKLKNGVTLKDFQTKYELTHHQLELNVDNIIKVCPYQLIDRFVLINPAGGDSTVFVDAKKFKFYDGTPTVGFFEILLSGNFVLAAQYKTSKQQSNYVEALDMGSREEKIIKDEQYFIIKGKNVLCELKSNTKSLACPEVEKIIPPNFKMKTRTLEDKIAFVDYLNQL